MNEPQYRMIAQSVADFLSHTACFGIPLDVLICEALRERGRDYCTPSWLRTIVPDKGPLYVEREDT